MNITEDAIIGFEETSFGDITFKNMYILGVQVDIPWELYDKLQGMYDATHLLAEERDRAKAEQAEYLADMRRTEDIIIESHALQDYHADVLQEDWR